MTKLAEKVLLSAAGETRILCVVSGEGQVLSEEQGGFLTGRGRTKTPIGAGAGRGALGEK